MIDSSFTSNSKNFWTLKLKEFLKKIIPFFILYFLFILVSQSFFEDSNQSVEAQIVKIMIDEKANSEVPTLDGHSERILQSKVIAALPPKELLIFGSSKSYELGKNILPQFDLHNHAMSSGFLEDFLALIHLHLKKGQKPKFILLGMDAKAFNDESTNMKFNGGSLFWDILFNDVSAMFDKIGMSSKSRLYRTEVFNRFYSWMLPKKAQLLLQKWTDYFSGHALTYRPEKTSHTEGVQSVIRADGTRAWHQSFRNSDPAWTNSAAQSYASERFVYFLGNYKNVSTSGKEILEKLIQFLQKEDIKLALYISPYHPLAYKILISRPDTKIILSFEEEIRAIADQYHVEVIGSVNPTKYNINDIDFYDGFHMRESGLKKIFNKKTIESFIPGN